MSDEKKEGYVPLTPPKKPVPPGKKGYVPPPPPRKPPEKPSDGRK